MIWMVLGCRYVEAEVSLREKLSFTQEQVKKAIGQLQERFPELEVVILSTCNRVEIYAARELEVMSEFPIDADAGLEILMQLWASAKEIEQEELQKNCFRHTGAEALEHLFQVASSLDSMVVGEGQIGGQVQSAYELAVQCGSVGPLLHAAFQRAGMISRKVTSETTIHQYRTSVASVAVSCYARQIFEHFEKKKTLVIGAGKMAEETLLYLREEGTQDITIVNRSISKAERMAETFHGKVRPWEELDLALTEADLVISLTGATEPIVTLDQFRKLEKSRSFRPILILDLAVPRDFDSRLVSLENVYLYTVDDLQSVCDANQDARNRDVPKAKRIVQEQLQIFLVDIRHRKSGRVIRELREFWDRPKEMELKRLFRKLPELTDAQRREIEYSFERLVNKLFHPTLESLHQAGCNPENQRGLLNAVRKLFGLK